MPRLKKTSYKTLILHNVTKELHHGAANMAAGMIRGFVVIFTVALAAIFTNTIWQHYHCETPWSRCNPAQAMPCEPVSKVLAEIKELKQMAMETR